jgi:methionine synthase II (cobalamin-independent)
VSGETVMSPGYRYHNKEKSIQFDTDMEIEKLVEDLRAIMQRNDSTQSYWTVCYLEVNSSGEYLFKFSYDEPPRFTKLNNS